MLANVCVEHTRLDVGPMLTNVCVDHYHLDVDPMLTDMLVASITVLMLVQSWQICLCPVLLFRCWPNAGRYASVQYCCLDFDPVLADMPVSSIAV